MLPVVDKPLIQYAAEEAVRAGCTQLIFVTSSKKRAIEDHFDRNFELEAKLEEAGKAALLETVREILPEGVSCAYVRQAEALGLGHAVLCARDVVGSEPFAVILADDLIRCQGPGCMEQMVAVFERHGGSVLGVEEVAPEETDKYGIVSLQSPVEPGVARVEGIVEKPKPAEAPSTQAVVGRYVLSPRIFELLEETPRGAGGEIQLTDAIAMLLHEEPVWAYAFEGVRYDCGSKLGYLQATVEYALAREDLGERFGEYLRRLTL